MSRGATFSRPSPVVGPWAVAEAKRARKAAKRNADWAKAKAGRRRSSPSESTEQGKDNGE